MFACSVGDEVATREEQTKAKNDRAALVVQYKKLQADFNKLSAKKNAEIGALKLDLENLSQQKDKEFLDATCDHALQMTQLQSRLVADVETYYSKSKALELEGKEKDEKIQYMSSEISRLQAKVQSLNDVLEETSPRTDTEMSSLSHVSTSPPSSPCPLEPSQHLQTSKALAENMNPSSLQLWNENLRSELQRVHRELDSEKMRHEAVGKALTASESERKLAEEKVDQLLVQIEELLKSKEQILATVKEIRKENSNLKANMRKSYI